MIKKILLIFFIIIISLNNNILRFYHYENKFKMFKLTRNNIGANCNVYYDKTSLTNEDVEVRFEFDKIVDIVENFPNTSISEDGKTITKIVTENEQNRITVRDEDFNYKDVLYNVNWIDKEPPQIIGAQNGNVYNKNVHLNYSDNYGIKEIYANHYEDSFSIYTETEDFYETDTVQMVPAKKTHITAYVTSSTKEMEKFRYFLNDGLYKTTSDKEYTFKGLKEETSYEVRVDALDRYGNVIDTRRTIRKTIPISNIGFSYNGVNKFVAIKGVPSTTTKVEVYGWVRGHFDDTYKRIGVYNDEVGSYVTSVSMADFKNYQGRYVMLFNVFYKNSSGKDVKLDIIGTVAMPNKYNSSNYSGLPNDFTYNGNYYVRCVDKVGNESEIEFTIQK